MGRERVAVYIDGFNLYHAIDELDKPHLKWVNVRKLAALLLKPKTQQLVAVRYFSALGNHFSGTPKVHRLIRHREYIRALEAKGVDVRLGNFAKRDLMYAGGPRYRAKWRRYEEKQTDVGIAVHLVHDAHCGLFDRALVVSLDTDMVPAFRIMKEAFPEKPVVCVAPPRRSHHRDIQILGVELENIKVSQLEKALFGARVISKGNCVARRPSAYCPP
ncbi:NYN domain-containing protein [Altererythrobacter sp. C41]|uniref:NYN domain-containing protein n=1 Tax=Altererythrobacter sp. C41 TaxID=2806021 RepID=UPI0019345CC1|nr:NYN domain-containing protein [Altererythrobacter sp. C41]